MVKERAGVKYMVVEREPSSSGEHTMNYIHVVLQNCTLETFIISLTNVTLSYLIKIKNKEDIKYY